MYDEGTRYCQKMTGQIGGTKENSQIENVTTKCMKGNWNSESWQTDGWHPGSDQLWRPHRRERAVRTWAWNMSLEHLRKWRLSWTVCLRVWVWADGADNRDYSSPGRRVGHAVVRRWVWARVLGSAWPFPQINCHTNIVSITGWIEHWNIVSTHYEILYSS